MTREPYRMPNGTLAPGDREAVKQGCTCTVRENRGGRGYHFEGRTQWVMIFDCPLHGYNQAHRRST